MKQVWQLLPFLQATGSYHMKLDEDLLSQHQMGGPSILRFYTWSPLAISLGYHQKKYPSFWSNLIWNGESIDLVRRPSGGRAVLHQGDLSYAIVTSGLKGSRMDIYHFLCEFLILGWQKLGVELSFSSNASYVNHASCFAISTGSDLVTPQGVKLIGSAMLIRGDAVLLHGSIQLACDPILFERVFGLGYVGHEVRLPSQLDVINALSEVALSYFEGDWLI